MKYTHIVVEGPIGVGKTSLASRLAEHFGARLALEQLDDNPFLKRYYADVHRLAFQTQISFLLLRYKQQMGMIERGIFDEMTVSDYMFSKDRIFANYVLDGDEYTLYMELYDMLAPMMPKHDLLILLQADVEVLMQRIQKRAYAYESDIQRSYLEGLIEAYDRYFFEYTETPLLVVNTNEVDLAADALDLEDLLKQVEKLDAGTTYYVPSKGRQ